MSIAYFISAYKLPVQLARLVSVLQHEDDHFFIHVDSKVSSDPFTAAMKERIGHCENIEFIEPVRCDWAGFGLVQATMDGLDRALVRCPDFSHFVLLTGQDYPIKPRDALRTLLHSNHERTFMSWAGLDTPRPSDRTGNVHWSWDGDMTRLYRRHFLVGKRFYGIPNRFTPFIPHRRLPAGLQPYQGLSYSCLSNGAARYVAQLVRTRPEFVRFFKRVLVPDENFFQMALINSPLRDSIINEDLRFMEWKDWHPAILRIQDFSHLMTTDKYIARKFDMSIDADIITMIEAKLLRPTPSA